MEREKKTDRTSRQTQAGIDHSAPAHRGGSYCSKLRRILDVAGKDCSICWYFSVAAVLCRVVVLLERDVLFAFSGVAVPLSHSPCIKHARRATITGGFMSHVSYTPCGGVSWCKCKCKCKQCVNVNVNVCGCRYLAAGILMTRGMRVRPSIPMRLPQLVVSRSSSALLPPWGFIPLDA